MLRLALSAILEKGRNNLAWIEFHLALRDHWKVNRLKDKLGIGYAQALGHIACLWTWVGSNAPSGDLKGFTSNEIDSAGRWEGAKNLFMEALKSSKLIDEKNKIHDWNKHGMRLIMSSRKRQKNYRNSERNSYITQTQQFRHTLSPSFSLSNNNAVPEKFKGTEAFIKTTEPFKSGLKDAVHFLARAGVVYSPEQIDRALKEIVGWCAKKPDWERGIKMWPKTIISWIKRNEKQKENLNNVDKIAEGIGKQL